MGPASVDPCSGRANGFHDLMTRQADVGEQMIVEAVMDDLMKKVAQRWTDEIVNTGRVQLLVKGATMGSAKSLKDMMEKALSGAKIEMRDVRNGQATFDVNVDGGAEKLAGVVDGKKAGKYTIEVLEFSRGKVVLKLNG